MPIRMDMRSTDTVTAHRRIVLAHAEPFQVGRLQVTPSTRQVAAEDGRAETIEPRVMQVLVALAGAKGAIMTRDELIDLCWDGRIVTDDAINRTLSHIRQIAAGIGEDSFAIETIARVGYRITSTAKRSEERPPSLEPQQISRQAIDRRTLVGGAAAVAAAAGIAGLWWAPRGRRRPAAEAQRLFDRAVELSREGLPGQNRQVTSYLERAVAIDPDFAAAWGLLSLAYSRELEHTDTVEPGTLPQRIRSAAQRSLALDPTNVDAKLGLVFVTPIYRNWAAKERELREMVAEHPDHWLAQGRLGVLLHQVGRFNDALAQHRTTLAIEPMLPAAYGYMINAFDSLGRIQEAEAAIETALGRWPSHPYLWRTTYAHLLFGNRAQDAALFAADPARRPASFALATLQSAERIARAAASDSAALRAAAVAELRGQLERDATAIPLGARTLALLGQPELALAGLDRFLLDRGSFGRPQTIGRYTRRITEMLFAPPLRALRGDPRYDALIRDTGLQDYWVRTGTSPDV